MATRDDERARRRAEREAQERKHQAARNRARRLQIVGGAILVVAVIAVVVILVAGSGGGDSGGGTSTAATSKVVLPPWRDKNLETVARSAGCTLKTYRSEGRTHTPGNVKYKTNPPTSGNHNPIPAADGVYSPGETPEPVHFVHSLEHGRIELQYKPGSPQKTIDTLVALFNEPFNGTPGYHVLVMENNTHMPYAIAATAWTHLLGCQKLSPQAIDAIRDFRDRYTDKGPEFAP